MAVIPFHLGNKNLARDIFLLQAGATTGMINGISGLWEPSYLALFFCNKLSSERVFVFENTGYCSLTPIRVPISLYGLLFS